MRSVLKQVSVGPGSCGIADVIALLREGTAMVKRRASGGKQNYLFTGYVIPMLPEILSTRLLALSEAVPRLCRVRLLRGMTTLGRFVRDLPIRSSRAPNYCDTRMRRRFRQEDHVAAPGWRTDFGISAAVLEAADDMNALSTTEFKKRRHHEWAVVLDLPYWIWVLDDEGKNRRAMTRIRASLNTLI